MKQWLMVLAITITLGEGALVQGPFTLTDEGGKAVLVVPKDGFLRGPAASQQGTILFRDDGTAGSTSLSPPGGNCVSTNGGPWECD